jgi:putative transposase
MSHTQPHTKLVKHYHDPGDFHELTFSCYRRMQLLTNDS